MKNNDNMVYYTSWDVAGVASCLENVNERANGNWKSETLTKKYDTTSLEVTRGKVKSQNG